MLEIRGIRKSYEGLPLLQGISLSIGRSETVSLLGASGSGKSTLLQIIAGLQVAEAGQVLWAGRDLSSLPAHQRDFGLVFQDYALFPHLNVFDNIAFGLTMKRWTPARIQARVKETLALVNLVGFDRRSVTDLSGGEQQRVALARALAPRPRLLMFDEPLGALDRALREDLLDELRAVLAKTHIPALYVTHDQDEALGIADRILLLHAGRVVRSGKPADVWARPGSAWAAEFLGLGNVFPGRVLDSARRAETPYGTFRLGCRHRHRVGDAVHLLVRPTPAQRGITFSGEVQDVLFQQDHYRVRLENGLFFDLERPPKIGRRAAVTARLECLGNDAAG